MRGGMGRTVMQNYDIILNNERKIMEEMVDKLSEFVDVGFLKKLSLKLGKRKFVEDLLVGTKLTLDAAVEVRMGEGKDKKVSEAALEISKTLSNVPYTSEVMEAHRKNIAIVIDHFLTLLDAEGASYEDLVRSAYGSKENYLASIERIEQVEKAMIDAIGKAAITGREKLSEKGNKIRKYIAQRRLREADKIFQ